MIDIGNESVLSTINGIFDSNDDNIEIYDSTDDLTFSDTLNDDVLDTFDLTTNIFDSKIAIDDIAYQIAQNNISLEESFFKKMWDFLLMILKKISESIINFFKIVINFFKRLVNFKSDLKKESEEVLKDKKILDKISEEIINKVSNNSKSEEDVIPKKSDLVVIIPGKEEEYLNILSTLYKNEFIGEFRKISFSLNTLAELPFYDKSQELIIDKIKDFEFKNQDYKDKINTIVTTLKDKKEKLLIKVDKENGNDVIKNALNRNKVQKWGSNEILKLMDSNNLNRMLSSLNQSIRKIKSKSDTISAKLQSSFRGLTTVLNTTISFTNKLFSECFSYIKAFLSTENINTKLSKMAIMMFNNEKKLTLS